MKNFTRPSRWLYLPLKGGGRSPAPKAAATGWGSFVSRFDRTPEKTRTARELRQNSTDVERHLWNRLRSGQIDGHRFRRQHPVGPYVLDFYCPRLRLAIELDGGQHNLPPEIERDQRRDAWLAARGITVLRYWNSDVVENIDGVLEHIAITAADFAAKSTVTPTRRSRP